MFYLQDQMTYIPNLEPCTRACRSFSLPPSSPAGLPLAPGTHCRRGSQAGSEWTTASRDTRSKPSISAVKSSLKSKTQKTQLHSPEKRHGRRAHTSVIINISDFPSWGSVASYRLYLNIGQNKCMTQFTCFFSKQHYHTL